FICGVHNANKTDWITCARTHHGKCGHVTGHVEIKRGRVCRDLPNQSAIKIPAAQHGFVFND
ncbi:unnamed protein product, partial [Hymenolepis diminuta]